MYLLIRSSRDPLTNAPEALLAALPVRTDPDAVREAYARTRRLFRADREKDGVWATSYSLKEHCLLVRWSPEAEEAGFERPWVLWSVTFSGRNARPWSSVALTDAIDEEGALAEVESRYQLILRQHHVLKGVWLGTRRKRGDTLLYFLMRR